jgi:hypothetical protein
MLIAGHDHTDLRGGAAHQWLRRGTKRFGKKLRANAKLRFLMRLALALSKSLREILSLSAIEVALWEAYQQFDPFGNDRQDFHAGQIAAVICNMFRSEAEKAKSPADMMPDWGQLRAAKEKSDTSKDWFAWEEARNGE